MERATKGRGRPREIELNDFGRRLRALISSSPVKTRAAFLRAVGCAPATLHRYETSERRPPLTMLKKMAEVLGVSANAIVGEGPISSAEANRALGSPFSLDRIRAQWRKPMLLNLRLRGSAADDPFPRARLDALLAEIGRIDLFRELELLREARDRLAMMPMDAEAIAEARARVSTFSKQFHSLVSLLWLSTSVEPFRFPTSGEPWPDDIP